MKEKVQKKEENNACYHWTQLFLCINITLATEETLVQSTTKWHYYLEVIL